VPREELGTFNVVRLSHVASNNDSLISLKPVFLLHHITLAPDYRPQAGSPAFLIINYDFSDPTLPITFESPVKEFYGETVRNNRVFIGELQQSKYARVSITAQCRWT